MSHIVGQIKDYLILAQEQDGTQEKMQHTWHLSKHVSQSSKSLSVQFHSARHERAFQEEVQPHPLRHGCRDENTQILETRTAEPESLTVLQDQFL